MASFVAPAFVFYAYDESFGGEAGGGWLVHPLPEIASLLLWLLSGAFVVIALGWEALVETGKRSNLEYEETPQGFDVFHHDSHPPSFRATRSAVPRGANVTFSVKRAGRGVRRKWKATIVANGIDVVAVEVAASRLDRVSFAPLRDLVLAQGGVLHATDPMAERLLGPPVWLAAQPLQDVSGRTFRD
jgi:hypothetical protein